jgi:hypothetical protein
MITKEDRAQELGFCPCCHHDLDSEENFKNLELINDEEFWETERAWLFYESGVQDMREIKSLIWMYKF